MGLRERRHGDLAARSVFIASVLFMGWYAQGLTPEQIEMLKAKRDAMALPVAEPPHKKKKWAQ